MGAPDRRSARHSIVLVDAVPPEAPLSRSTNTLHRRIVASLPSAEGTGSTKNMIGRARMDDKPRLTETVGLDVVDGSHHRHLSANMWCQLMDRECLLFG